MNRATRIALGSFLIALFVAGLVLPWYEPLRSWTASSTFTGWLVFGVALFVFLTGVSLIATPRAERRKHGE